MTAILGGGISGLSAAYYCLENPKLGPIALYEASNRLGGWIKSIKSPRGVIFEKGPRTVRLQGSAGKNTLELIENLNLDKKIVPIRFVNPVVKNRLIYANNKLHLLPNSITSLFKVKEPFNQRLISVLWRDLRTAKIPKEDESIYSFVERRMGQEVADYLISPLICGICAGDAKKISVKFLLNAAFEYEQKYGSMTKGLLSHLFNRKSKKKQSDNAVKNNSDLVKKSVQEQWVLWGLQGGLEQLPVALTRNLSSNSNIKINKRNKCEQITFKLNEVELLVDGNIQTHRRVISSLSAKDLAPLLQRQHPQLSRELDAIPLVNVAVVNLHFTGDVLPMKGFGFLVPPNQNLPILGVIFDSCVFKSASSTVLTVMMGGAWFDKYFGDNATEEQFLSTAVNHTKQILDINEDPVEYDVSILKNCIPQYVVGHRQRLERIENYISAHKIPLSLCGSSYQGVGLNDVILSAKVAVSHMQKCIM